MRENFTIEQAKAYLQEHQYGRLRVIYDGKQRTIANSAFGTGVLVNIPHKRYGHWIDWAKVEKVWRDVPPSDQKITEKFIKKAKKATFTNSFIRKCLEADVTKGPCANNLTTGTSIDGNIISLTSIGKEHPYWVNLFREALAERRGFHSPRLPFRGYDATLWINDPDKHGEVCGGLSMEYKGCGNGYYYLLINDEEFIGADID